MIKRLTFLFFTILFGFMMLSVFDGSAASAEPVILKAVAGWPKTTSDYKAFAMYVDILENITAKKAPGELKVQIIGGPEAIKSTEQVPAVQRGMVDMAFTTTAYYVSVLPEVDSLKLSDFKPEQERTNGAWALMNEIHEKKIGVHYLGRIGLGIKFHLYLKKPIKKADLTGLNIRVSPMYIQAIKGLGGNPLVIPPTEVYVALERNVADGYCWPSVGVRDWGWQKQTKYIVDPAFYSVPNPLVINMETWNKLPQKLQDVLTEASVEAEKKVVAEFEKMAAAERPLLAKEGVNTIKLPPAESAKFLKVAYDEGWKDFLAKNPENGTKLKQLLTKGGKGK